MIRQYGFFVDSSVCSGCKACLAACRDKNDLGPGQIWRRIYEVAGGRWEKKEGLWVPTVAAYNVSLACNHCENPVCALSCPTRAIGKREDGLVFIESDRCIGCRYCEWACPYGAIRFDAAANVVSKCDFCADLLDAGRPPACVAACPLRALDFGDVDELREKYGALARVFPLADPALTQPALVLKPHRDAARAEAVGAEVANWEEV